ncbi:MAG: EF-hand domain-containing protein [Congregibacter sp.]|nr:EF-hand domain-containing protein [Congregibacter sp.]MDP5070738.1 EF-hand domain-containing protein [Congregibacter sp.]
MKKNLTAFTGTAALLAAMVSVAQPQGGMLRLDADGDGQISREEFKPPSDRGGPKFFKRADADGNGELTRDEMTAAMEASQERQEQMRTELPQMFDAMDADGNGVVSRTEAEDQVFTQMDTNGDGFVSQDEAKAMHDKRGKRRKPDAAQR